MKKVLLKSILAASVFGMISTAVAVDRRDLNSAIQINYGAVERVDRVKVKSDSGKNAVMGGMLGAATSGHHHRGKHALEGALAAGILTAMLEGKHKAYSYQVVLTNGSSIKLVTEQSGIQKGDCVSVEQGRTSNIRRVSSVYCEHSDHDAVRGPHVVAAAQMDAAECHTAREFAMRSQTDKELDLALKKVRIFCGD